jgi:hypothetical protein
VSDIAAKRKLVEQANLIAKSNDPEASFAAMAGVIDAIATLISGLTGESVRVRISAVGQPELLDMVKHPVKH